MSCFTSLEDYHYVPCRIFNKTVEPSIFVILLLFVPTLLGDSFYDSISYVAPGIAERSSAILKCGKLV